VVISPSMISIRSGMAALDARFTRGSSDAFGLVGGR
jgi:hypothetical protein